MTIVLYRSHLEFKIYFFFVRHSLRQTAAQYCICVIFISVCVFPISFWFIHVCICPTFSKQLLLFATFSFASLSSISFSLPCISWDSQAEKCETQNLETKGNFLSLPQISTLQSVLCLGGSWILFMECKHLYSFVFWIWTTSF